MKRNWKNITTFLLLMLPSVFMQYILIKLFPYTGLARVMTVPATFVINSLLIFVCITITIRV
ncbi:fatty-acid desaturase [Paenibacillus turicensis]|uniref:Fatty-acid desaturase n=1 Tax=Paenibacillus turicensis TaxID=160487 RepID=A0ABS4FLJ8_9BACL|nr:fatty-acid desaturase [Paenibacillus turicensis]